jgi:GNAT superfamily N-acetyltransferase
MAVERLSAPAMELAPANLNPFETNRLLQDLAAYYSNVRQWPREGLRAKDLATQLITGETNGTLWLREPDAAAAVAVWDKVPGAGVRVSDLHLDAEHRTPADFTRFLESLARESEPEGGLFAVTDTIAGVTPHYLGTFLEPLGFLHVPRKLLRTFLPGTPTLDGRGLPSGRLVSVGIDNLEKLVALHSTVHSGRRDRVFAGNPLDMGEDGRRTFSDLFMNLDASGAGLRHHPWGCMGVEDGGELVAAMLTREDMLFPKEKGWILDVMVRPDRQGQGLDEHLLGHFLKEAGGHGLREISVEVAEGDPLLDVYGRTGFQILQGQAGERKGMWVRAEAAKALGLS